MLEKQRDGKRRLFQLETAGALGQSGSRILTRTSRNRKIEAKRRLSQSSQSTQRKSLNPGKNLKGYAFLGDLCALAR
jgi:hypothetical protein